MRILMELFGSLLAIVFVVYTAADPTSQPSSRPTTEPTVTLKPTPMPTSMPSDRPTSRPTSVPTLTPTIVPSMQPSSQPSFGPTQPTGQPTGQPSHTPLPSSQPSSHPSSSPSISQRPTIFSPPTSVPSSRPTRQPIARPSSLPTAQPSFMPTSPTSQPTTAPSSLPSMQPSGCPTVAPTSQPSVPTSRPSSRPSVQPTSLPTCLPTAQPSSSPSAQETAAPTVTPTLTKSPTGQPSSAPSMLPSCQPSSRPTGEPTFTCRPSAIPTSQPTSGPTEQDTAAPTSVPSTQPSFNPTSPSSQPTSLPSVQPTSVPLPGPSSQPTTLPSSQPTSQPSFEPTQPSSQPSALPSQQPSAQPSTQPTVSPKPTSQPSNTPTGRPTAQPVPDPTSTPTNTPRPSSFPSSLPTGRPSSQPTFAAFFGLTTRPTALYENVDVTGTVTFEPDNVNSCNPVSMRIQIAFNQNITTGGSFVLTASGLTTGACINATDGSNLASVLTPNTDKFDVSFTEGSYIDGYANSKLGFGITGDDIVAGRTYEVVIDRANLLRRACSANQSWAVTLNPVGRTSGIVGYIDLVEAYPKRCYHYRSQLNFSLPHPQFFTGINLSLHLAYTVTRDTTVTIHLPRFTNAIGAFPLNTLRENATQLIGNGADTALRNLTFSTNFSWAGQWIEGDYENTFRDSRIVLNALGFQPFTGEFWVFIPKENHISASCGHPRDSALLQVSTDGVYFTSNRTNVDEAQAIGPGCSRALNQCSGHGNCDFCTARCNCDDGFGSEVDKLRVSVDDFSHDCSSRACPYGPSVGSVVRYFSDINSTQSFMHRDAECSGNGICDRSSGVCRCNSGFTGSSCQKMACSAGLSAVSSSSGSGNAKSKRSAAAVAPHLGNPAHLCSGRGRCLPMTRLAQTAAALPLSSRSVDYRGGNASFGFEQGTWDGDFGHTCVCDSQWEVGLKANQTQLAEFFGPGCELRRCPSGDDPTTPTVDETDCEGINQTGGLFRREFGAAGNRCHVDCANRGLCDYSSGICSCFAGFTGSSCDRRDNGNPRLHRITVHSD